MLKPLSALLATSQILQYGRSRPITRRSLAEIVAEEQTIGIWSDVPDSANVSHRGRCSTIYFYKLGDDPPVWRYVSGYQL